MIDVNRNAAALLQQEERSQNGAQARCHGESLPAAGFGGRVVAAKDAVNRPVTRTQEKVQKVHKGAWGKKLP